MSGLKFNFIDNNFNNCKSSMIKHFIDNNIIPKYIFYYTNNNIFMGTLPFYKKIEQNELLNYYDSESYILIDLINCENNYILKSLHKMYNVIIFSTSSIYIKNIKIYYIYYNHLFTYKNLCLNKTTETDLFNLYKKKYYKQNIKKQKKQNKNYYQHFNKTEFFIENIISLQNYNNQNNSEEYIELALL